MSEEVTPSPPEGASATTPETEAPIEPPSDFREYVKWRQTGVLPAKAKEEPPPATAAEPPVTTEPQSGADVRTESEDEDEEPARTGRGSSRTRKIDRLTRENEQLRMQLATAQRPQPAPPEPPKVEPPGKPKLQDFPTLEAYQEALTDWKIDQREAAKRVEAEQAAAKAAAEKAQTAWDSTESAARTAHPDYDDVVQSVRAPEGPGVPAMRQAMLEDDAGGEILYYLGTHPDELRRIAAMQPVAAVKEIGKLAAAVVKPPDPGNAKQRVVSSAPKPPAPLSHPAAGAIRKDILDENFARNDYRSWESERIAQIKSR
jgi:hypothetical protein